MVSKSSALNLPISGPLIQEKALSFAKFLKKDGFKASNGWLNRFKTRHSISQAVICGESGCVDKEVVQSWKSRLPDIAAGYATCDIYNKQLLQTGCSKVKFANTTTPLTRPLDDGPIGGQVSGVPLYIVSQLLFIYSS